MKTPPILLIAGLCAGGLIAGFGARRITVGTEPAATPAATGAPAAPRRAISSARPVTGTQRRAGRVAPAEMPHLKSADTLESLLALSDNELYSRLAAWLTDATEPDIAAFWANYGPRKGRSNDITDLVFLNWTRLDPQAAIAGSSSDQHAWWAWACHDPAGALAHATAHAERHVNHVAWGIGEFHPEWLRAHFHELNQGAKDNALRGLAKWEDRQDPLAAMEFLKEIGHQVSKGTFQALVRQDPWTALDWLKENPGRGDKTGLDYSISDPMGLIVETMARERPDDLKRLAAQTPPGEARLKMEAALFKNLLASDPEAALQQAKETVSPRVAAERYAALGLAAVKSDREQAFGLAKELLTKAPDGLQMMTMVEYPNGGSGSGQDVPGVSEFLTGLMADNPARTLDLTLGLKATPHGSAFEILSSQWIARDFPGYTNWVEHQPDAAVRVQGENVIVNQLQQEKRFEEAAPWVLRQPESPHYDQLANLLANWKRTDPDAAAEWFESADLSAERREKIQTQLERNR